jgi:hypothetical protein
MSVKIICRVCGHEMMQIIYPTDPPQYGNKCTHCGRNVDDKSTTYSGGREPVQIITK